MGRLVKGYELDVGEYTGRLPTTATDGRPANPENGQVIFNTDTSKLEVYRNGAWEQAAIVGNTTVAKDSFMGDGSSTTFSPLSYYYYPFDAVQVLVFVENVFQEPDIAYTLHENQIIFADPIPNGMNIVILHGYATVGSNPNTSQLQTLYIPLLTSLVPEISASQPTYTRANVATFTDYEGWIRQVATNEARFQGMRRVENLLTDSEDLNDVSWLHANAGTGTTPVVTSGQTDPDSGSTAWRVQLDKGAGGTSGDYSFIRGNVTSTVGHDYARSVWLRSNTGGNQIVRLRADGASTVDIEVTTSWQRFSALAANVAASSTTETSLEILTRGDLVTTQSVDIFFWHPQVEDVTRQTNQAPGDYVSAEVESWPYHGAGVDRVKYFDRDNGNFVSNVYVTEQTGNVITAPVFQGMKFEPASENLILYSEDFANTWTTAFSTVSSMASSGPPPNSQLNADALVPNSGAVTSYVTQSGLSTSATDYTFSIFLKNGELGYPWVELTVHTPTNYRAWFDLSTGTKGSNANVSTDDYGIKEWKDGWYRVWMTAPCSAGTAEVYVTARDGDGSFGAVTGDASTPVWYMSGAQFERQGNPTSYIPTTNLAVTRGADIYTISATDHIYDDQGTAFAEYAHEYVNVTFPSARIIGTASSQTPLWFGSYASPIAFYDQTVSPVIYITVLDGIKIRGATSWNASTGVVNLAGNEGSTETSNYNGTIGGAGPTLAIGADVSGGSNFIGTIRNVRIWNKFLSLSKLSTLVSHPFALLLEDGSLLLLQDGNYVLLN